jgi:hypothetical protein
MMRFTTTKTLALARSAGRIAQGGQERSRRLPTAADAKRSSRRLIQNLRSARRDHDLIPFASSRIADAAAGGLNAPPTTLKVSKPSSTHGRPASHKGGGGK